MIKVYCLLSKEKAFKTFQEKFGLAGNNAVQRKCQRSKVKSMHLLLECSLVRLTGAKVHKCIWHYSSHKSESIPRQYIQGDPPIIADSDMTQTALAL